MAQEITIEQKSGYNIEVFKRKDGDVVILSEQGDTSIDIDQSSIPSLIEALTKLAQTK